jgi:hypothetical protein
MKTEKIYSFITPKSTGYMSAAGVGLAIASGVSKNKSFRKYHKPLALFSGVCTLLHIGLIEYYNHKYAKSKSNN